MKLWSACLALPTSSWCTTALLPGTRTTRLCGSSWAARWCCAAPRGYAPLPVRLDMPELAVEPNDQTILAVGAHFKNSVALAIGRDVFISQHIGDLETTQATEAFKRVIGDFERLYEASPSTVVCDAHPDYLSTRYAEGTGLPVHKVQHHVAHVYACMAENGITGPALGVSWDGTGYGDDGTVWGGEFFRMAASTGYKRVAHLRTFRLPGGEKAVREPKRSAIGVLHELLGENLAARTGRRAERSCPAGVYAQQLSVWAAMMNQGVNAPVTSSAGRLFDAVASITGICHNSNFEGQAAMQLEYAIDGLETDERYGFKVIRGPHDGEGWATGGGLVFHAL